MPFTPGDPWPGTAGGAAHDSWSGYVRFYLQAQIAAGNPFTMGPHTYDRLTDGNVMSRPAAFGAEPQAAPGVTTWVDLTCDCIDVEIDLGSSSAAGILSKAEAGTLTATLYDPDAKYDPANPDSIYVLRGKTRLEPGVGVRAFCEVINDPTVTSPTVTQYPLFYGTADRWEEDWEKLAGDRKAKLVATDPTKVFVRSDRPGRASPVGGGAILTHLNTIVFYMGWTGTVQPVGPATVATVQPSTLAQPAWEMVNRTLDDELGFVWFTPPPVGSTSPGILTFTSRAVWTTTTPPAVTIGCGPGMHDIAVDVTPASFDTLLKNSVYASRTGGTQQTARNQTSIDRWFEQSLHRTDLGLADDQQVSSWAQTIVTFYAFPRTTLSNVVLRPDVDPAPWDAWNAALAVNLVTSVIRVLWEAAGYTADVNVRPVGWAHKIGTDAWEIEWRTVAASLTTTTTFHMGPHAQDRLDAGYMLA